MFPKFQLIQKQTSQDIKPITIKVPQKTFEGVQLSQQTKQILNSSFISSIIGKPGSGKSHLISQLVNRRQFYGKRFNRILYIGPTRFTNVIQDQGNWNPILDQQWIQTQIRKCIKWGATSILVILDDVVTQISNKKKSLLQQLLFNRRHLIPNGVVSWIITSQKYKLLPLWLRSNLDQFWTFGVSPTQQQHLIKETSINIQKNLLQAYLKRLKDHMFLYFNIKKGKIYNHQFQKL